MFKDTIQTMMNAEFETEIDIQIKQLKVNAENST